MFCAQNPSQNINFGYGPADEVKRRLLTLWNSVSFFVTYANIDGFDPKCGTAPRRERRRSTAGSSRGRAQLVREATELPTTATGRRRSCDGVRELRRRSLELVHPPLAPALLGRRARRRSRRSGDALVQALRVVAPVMPFLADHLWRDLVAEGPNRSSSRAWPEADDAGRGAARGDGGGAASRRARTAGARAVRAQAPPAAAPARRPGRGGRAARTAGEIAEELSVKEVEFGDGRGDRAARQAEPAAARPEARQASSGRCGSARGRRVRGARRRPLARRRPRALGRARCSSSVAARRAGRSPVRTA